MPSDLNLQWGWIQYFNKWGWGGRETRNQCKKEVLPGYGRKACVNLAKPNGKSKLLYLIGYLIEYMYKLRAGEHQIQNPSSPPAPTGDIEPARLKPLALSEEVKVPKNDRLISV